MENLEKGTFYRSYYEAGKYMPDDQKLEYYEKLFSYLFYGEETESEGIVEAVFQAVKPNLKCSRERAIVGAVGGSVSKNAGNKHASKIKAKSKQNQSNVKEKEKEKEKEEVNNKKIYGEYKNVKLDDSDWKKLTKNLLWKRDEYISKLDEYIETTGKKYTNHCLTMLAWARKAGDTTPRDVESMSTKEWITFMKQLKEDKHDFMYELILRRPDGANMYPTISLAL